MSTVNITKILITVLCGIFLVGSSGCDKLSFLSDYFPSLKKKEDVQPVSPVNVSSVRPTGNALATVDNWTLTKEEFNEKLNALKEMVPDYDINDPEARRLVLDELVRQQLLVKDAEQRGLAKSNDIVQAVEEFRRTLIIRELASEITKGINVTLDQAREYYDQNKNALAEPAQWHIREIAVPTQPEAKQLLIDLLQGADFAATAKTKSKTTSAQNGGDLGFLTEFPSPQMESAAFTLEIGAISSVFKGPEGYYVIKLEEKRGGLTRDFFEVQDDIQAGLLLMQQQQAILDYIDKLQEKATVEINESLL